MSRAAASSQTEQTQIYHVTAKTHQGVLSTVRSQQLGNNSFAIDEGVLAILTQLLLDYANRRNEFKSTRDILNPGKFATKGLATITWIRVLNIALGFGASNSLVNLQQVAATHLAASASDNNASLKTKFFRFLGLERTRVGLLHPAKTSLFPVIPIHPNQLIEAILHADEKMMRDLLNANPELLLKEGTATDYQGRTFTGTPLQAAIAMGDVAPNTNSTGIVEIILERLKQLKPDTYQDIFEKQAREIYEKSIRVYLHMQEKEITRLCKLGGELPANDPQQTGINEKIRKAQENVREHTKALCSKDLETLFKTHEKAQADNAFDFEPYVKAILDIDLNNSAQKSELDDVMKLIDANALAFSEFSDDEIHAFKEATNRIRIRNDNERAFFAKINSMGSQNNNGGSKFDPWEVRLLMHLAEKTGRQDLVKSLQDKIKRKTADAIAATGVGPRESDEYRNLPFDQLTLVQKLNRFREKFVLHMKQEPIFNPHHILKSLEHNNNAWNTHSNQDPNYHKRTVIFSQLVGWAQRNAAESVRQDLRQGTYYLTEKNERRARLTRFNEADSSCTLENIMRDVVTDVSSVDSSSVDGCGYKFGAVAAAGALRCWFRDAPSFKLMSNKNSKLSELITPRLQSAHRLIA